MKNTSVLLLLCVIVLMGCCKELDTSTSKIQRISPSSGAERPWTKERFDELVQKADAHGAEGYGNDFSCYYAADIDGNGRKDLIFALYGGSGIPHVIVFVCFAHEKQKSPPEFVLVGGGSFAKVELEKDGPRDRVMLVDWKNGRRCEFLWDKKTQKVVTSEWEEYSPPPSD